MTESDSSGHDRKFNEDECIIATAFIGALSRNLEYECEKEKLTDRQTKIILLLGARFMNQSKGVEARLMNVSRLSRLIQGSYDVTSVTAEEDLKNLQESGFITRTTVDYDKRNKEVMLTDKGISTYRRMCSLAAGLIVVSAEQIKDATKTEDKMKNKGVQQSASVPTERLDRARKILSILFKKMNKNILSITLSSAIIACALFHSSITLANSETHFYVTATASQAYFEDWRSMTAQIMRKDRHDFALLRDVHSSGKNYYHVGDCDFFDEGLKVWQYPAVPQQQWLDMVAASSGEYDAPTLVAGDTCWEPRAAASGYTVQPIGFDDVPALDAHSSDKKHHYVGDWDFFDEGLKIQQYTEESPQQWFSMVAASSGEYDALTLVAGDTCWEPRAAAGGYTVQPIGFDDVPALDAHSSNKKHHHVGDWDFFDEGLKTQQYTEESPQQWFSMVAASSGEYDAPTLVAGDTCWEPRATASGYTVQPIGFDDVPALGAHSSDKKHHHVGDWDFFDEGLKIQQYTEESPQQWFSMVAASSGEYDALTLVAGDTCWEPRAAAGGYTVQPIGFDDVPALGAHSSDKKHHHAGDWDFFDEGLKMASTTRRSDTY